MITPTSSNCKLSDNLIESNSKGNAEKDCQIVEGILALSLCICYAIIQVVN